MRTQYASNMMLWGCCSAAIYSGFMSISLGGKSPTPLWQAWIEVIRHFGHPDSIGALFWLVFVFGAVAAGLGWLLQALLVVGWSALKPKVLTNPPPAIEPGCADD
jgi:hypothetical protein